MSEDYIAKIIKRADLQQIRSFLITGADIPKTSKLSYKKRLNNDSKDIIKLLNNLKLPKEQHNEVFDALLKAFAIYEEVYAEIGMKAGARLVCDLLDIRKQIFP